MDELQRFCREGVAWRHLRHPNILPLLGVTVSEPRFALVSEWMENGNINEFIRRDWWVNRVELVRFRFTAQEPVTDVNSVGWRCKWLEVYARPPYRPWRFERGTNFSNTRCLHTYVLLIYEGKHTDKRRTAELHRRLWPLHHHWRRSPCCRCNFSNIVDLK